MAKISSRQDIDSTETHVANLQEILTVASQGAYGELGQQGVVVQVQDTLTGLLDQTDELFECLTSSIDRFAIAINTMRLDMLATSCHLTLVQDTLNKLIETIQYDECLDKATTDLLGELTIAGAETSADGKLLLTRGLSLSKEDLKPILRRAISSWIMHKLAQ